MKLLPSLRQKKRYCVFTVKSEVPLTIDEIQREVEQVLHSFLGDFGIAKLSPLFLKERSKNQKFIIKVNHTGVDLCKTAIILIKKIKNNPVIITSLTVSGTLKSAEERSLS